MITLGIITQSKSSARRLVVFVVFLVFLGILGIGGLRLAASLDDKSISYHLVRDLSLALVISALVTGAYEVYVRGRVDFEKISSVLSTVAGSSVPPNVWEDIKRTLLTRSVIRRHCEIRLSIKPIENDTYSLEYEFSYEIFNLLSKAEKITVRFGLDEHIIHQASGLPRFLACCFGGKAYTIPGGGNWKSEDQQVKVENGLLSFDIELDPSPAICVPISVRRSEVRNCPGSYYLLMTELTEGLRIYLENAPPSVGVCLMVRPDENEVTLDSQNPLFATTGVLLPGHGVELKLKPCSVGASERGLT